jgi:hydrogenase maturation factor HypF (carbamoyltransferase family)
MNEFFKKHKIEMVVCRNCDFPMEYEGENPRRYHLFRCKTCGNRVGILGKTEKLEYIAIKVPPDLKQRIETLAKAKGTTISDIVREALEGFLQESRGE